MPQAAPDPLHIINYNGDLKSFIRQLADQLGLNVIFDTQSFRQPRSIEINLKDVTTAQALDWVFLQEGLFFQKLSRRTILVADQNRRPQYQQLVIRTFYLSNADPNDARQIITQAIPPQQGRPQTIVIPDKSTNSLTVRDTAENVRLIEDILKSIDKDRAEVVMDVNIYEVSNEDLMQIGNQIGPSDAGSVVTLGGGSALAGVAGSRQVATQTFPTTPTALGAALLLPQSQLIALQRKGNTKLLASTQVHAFNGEESTARIGQRVPVQTAQTYPFGNYSSTTPSTGGTGTTPGVFSGGFPVIQYEPTGLTLKFTPQVFPNQDVQVKMSIESKDVIGAATLTPTFTERTITGTARVQNNRTMMLASVATDKVSNGRQGVPFLGLIPVLGRFFTAPRRENAQTDVVIAVTPRVLRAPAITPNDEDMRPSGTLQTPTTGSLEAMVQEANREDQIAAARKLPTNAVVELPASGEASYVPAPRTMMGTPAAAGQQGNSAAAALQNTIPTSYNAAGSSSLSNAVANSLGESPNKVANTADTGSTGAVNGGDGSLADKLREMTSLQPTSGNNGTASAPAGSAELKLTAEKNEFRVGETQRVAIMLSTGVGVGSAAIRLKFDPKVLTVKGLTQGEQASGPAPTIMQSIDPAGNVILTVTPQNGSILNSGSKVLVYIEVQAIGAGDAKFGFDREQVHVVSAGAGEIGLQMTDAQLTVKQ
jgi:general secretion pathway protein D